jgi:hypothetical protein
MTALMCAFTSMVPNRYVTSSQGKITPILKHLHILLQSCSSISSVFVEGGNLQIGSDGTNLFTGYIDEVLFFR